MLLTAFRLKTPRSLLSTHALVSSVLQEIQEEISQHELEIVSEVQFDGNTRIGFEEATLLLSLLFVSWCSYYYYYCKKEKLNDIHDYSKIRKLIRSFIYVFAFVFLRNVENAI